MALPVHHPLKMHRTGVVPTTVEVEGFVICRDGDKNNARTTLYYRQFQQSTELQNADLVFVDNPLQATQFISRETAENEIDLQGMSGCFIRVVKLSVQAAPRKTKKPATKRPAEKGTHPQSKILSKSKAERLTILSAPAGGGRRKTRTFQASSR